MQKDLKRHITSKYIHQAEYKVHYYVSGAEHRETIFFIHPAFADHRSFNKQIDRFSKRFKVITMDLLGHGATQSELSDFTFEKSLSHIEKIFAKERLTAVHFVGVSLGCLVAQYFRNIHPDKVTSLVMTGGYDINQENKDISKFQKGQQLLLTVMPLGLLKQAMAKLPILNRSEQKRFLAMFRKVSRNTIKVTLDETLKVAKHRSIPEIQCPVLLLYGEADVALSKKTMNKWHETSSNTRLEVIPNAGHYAHMDNADRFNDVVFDFLSN